MGKRILFGTILALVILLAIALPASAMPPTEVSGQYSLVGSTMDMASFKWSPAGKNCKLEVDISYPFTGDLDGDALFHYSAMVHGPCTVEMPPLPGLYDTNLHARGTFVGWVNGQAGTFDFTYEGREMPWQEFEPGALALTARIVILSGTADLANLHGVLDVANYVADPYDTYSGRIHFDPAP